MKLLYRTAEWHGLAKLRMHTESSLALLESLTVEFGLLIQNFEDLTCSQFETTELPSETPAPERDELNNSAPETSQSNNNGAAFVVHSTSESSENTAPPTSHANLGPNVNQAAFLGRPTLESSDNISPPTSNASLHSNRNLGDHTPESADNTAPLASTASPDRKDLTYLSTHKRCMTYQI